MKKIFILLFATYFYFTGNYSYAQSFAEKIISSIPNIPTQVQYIETGYYPESFTNEIQKLDKQIDKYENDLITNAQKSIGKKSATPKKTYKEPDMKQIEEGLSVVAQMMEDLDLTEDEFQKLSKMNDEEAEKFIYNRMKQKGINPQKYATQIQQTGMANQQYSDNDQTNVDIAARTKAIETSENFRKLKQETEKKIATLRNKYNNDMKELWKRYEKPFATLDENIAAFDTIESNKDYNKNSEELQKLTKQYRSEIYKIHSEFVKKVQLELKKILKYAVEADEANANQPDIIDDVSYNEMRKIPNNSLRIAREYLEITAEEPKENVR